MIIIHHDKETFGHIDLKKCGAYKYASDPRTDCLLTSGVVEWAKGDREEKVRRWRPGDEFPYLDVHPDDIEIHAWNSQFERLMWKYVMVPVYGWPKLALEQFVCVSAQARMMAAGPASLDKAGAFFQRGIRKDQAGHNLMMRMCKPSKHLQDERGHHTPQDIERLHDYCDVDTWSEIDVEDILPPWTEEALNSFWTNEEINDRGIVVDVDFAAAALAYADDEKAYFASEVIRLSGGAVETPRQFKRIQEFLRPLLSDEAIGVCEYYDKNKKKFSMDADTRGNLLSEAARDPDWLAYDPGQKIEVGSPNGDGYQSLWAGDLIAEFVEALDAAGKSAIAKYEAILGRAVRCLTDDNWRVHGSYVMAGASQSSRYSSVALQAHNMIRDVPKNAAKGILAFKRDDEWSIRAFCKEVADAHNAKLPKVVIAGKEKAGTGGQRLLKPEPIHIIARCVRPTITGCPEGKFDLVWSDWSSIEACMLPWLTLDQRAEYRLEMFRRGEDVYSHTASGILTRLARMKDPEAKAVKITKKDDFERQAYGKVPDLSLGYLGGQGALSAMARNYGVRMEDDVSAGTVKAWRAENPWAMDFGAACENAAMAAIRRPGVGFSAGRLEYRYDTFMLDGMGALTCTLPSGFTIVYPAAEIEMITPGYGGKPRKTITAAKASWNPKKGETEWPRVALWKGLLVENACQATATGAGGILGLGLERARSAGLIVCAHTHDEIVIESANVLRDGALLHKLMTQRPDWPGADLLPLRAEWGAGFRYKVKHDYEEKRIAA